MADYYVNQLAQSNGDHEVHVVGCLYMPSHKTYLGNFSSCQPAVSAAKGLYPTANGCIHCSNACHTQ